MEKLGRYHLKWWLKLTVLEMVHSMMEHYFCGIFAKNVYFESNHEETSDKPNVRDILHKKPVLFKIVTVTKKKKKKIVTVTREKATMRNSFRLKDTKKRHDN